MKGPMCVGLLAVVLLQLLDSVRAANQDVMYVALGDKISLWPEKSSVPLTSILWKYNGNLAAEWVEGKVDLEFYGKFKVRSSLDTTTGELVVNNMAKDDSGQFYVEINNQEQSNRYNVKVIRKVPEPELRAGPLVCTASSEKCSLICNGIESISDAEPISYSWKRNNQTIPVSTANLTITNDEETRRVRRYSCSMKNPVSEKESNVLDNPFYQEVSGGGLTAGQIVIIFVVIVLVVVVCVAVWKREMIGEQFNKLIGKEQPVNNQREDKRMERESMTNTAPSGNEAV